MNIVVYSVIMAPMYAMHARLEALDDMPCPASVLLNGLDAHALYNTHLLLLDSDHPLLLTALARIVLSPVQPLYTRLALGGSPLIALRHAILGTADIKPPYKSTYVILRDSGSTFFQPRLLLPNIALVLMRLGLSYLTNRVLEACNVGLYGYEYRCFQCLGLAFEVLVSAPLEMIKRNLEQRLFSCVYCLSNSNSYL